MDVQELRWALESILGTSDPRQVRGARVLAPEEARALVERIWRQSLTREWTEETRRQWLLAIDASTRWDEVVPPHEDLDLRRRPDPSGGAYLELVDRDVEEAQRRDVSAPRPKAAWTLSFRVPRGFAAGYAAAAVAALALHVPRALQPLPRQSDAVLAAAIARRVVGLVLAVVFAPLALVVHVARTYTIIPRHPPLPRGTHGL